MGSRRRWLGASLFLSLTGCQLVFGDFTVEPGVAQAALGDACAPDTFRCTGAELQRCSDDRRSWVTVKACADADHCDPQAATCRACSPGQWACNGALLESCDPNAHWSPAPTPCPTPELCSIAGNRGSGSCLTPVCDTPGAYSCDGNRLERCAAGRDALELVDRCGSDALCDAAKADAQARAGGRGTCTPPACLAGQFACNGATLERCRDDETDWEAVTTCADATSCNPLAGACSACTPGDATCSGAELWVCGANGFAKAATCAAPELCDPATAQCDAPECTTPGAVRCVTADVTELQECGNDRRWAVREACLTGTLCSESAGACLPPACGIGDVRCFGQVHQTCSGDLTHWVDDRTCPDDQTCDPDAGCEPPCNTGEYRCDGATLELCSGQHWQAQNRCATHKLCDEAAPGCNPPQCGGALGAFLCAGDQNVKYCPESRDVWSDLRTCAAGTYCDADPAVGSGQPSCDACRPLAYTCEESELHLCTADGSAAPLVEECPGGCTVSADNVPTCVQTP